MKTREQTFNLNLNNYRNSKLKILDICPNCGVSNNPINKNWGSITINQTLVTFFSHECTSCQKKHFSIQRIFPDNTEQTKLLTFWPQASSRQFNKLLVEFSPTFISMYHQAEAAELHNDFEIAGIGYRAAEEILIKDYALKILNQPKEEISKMNLNNSISKYFKDDNAAQVATDVVRINGNDYAHWDKPENFDAELKLVELKNYLEIFIQIILVKLMLLNPPVSRNKK
ncbi:DUF4145 domain-containing protein [Liquorilactobacillus nagelii]|uniref:DUF4145 domain-containing protein n=1 Tax=Liquorilactobacillus nagelii TaxID=82688 RepID=UPI0006EF636E|nr:DUF4145 domain-containing protein [Liquorilactobacillus nagelii]KRL40758.1 hypothetical protein FD45_GL001403 [Liquorilactobacillus nagelii DSM 13675]QYH53722.1 DUF4145 domain-containing protein [Liquorilactobacillus nagelii DSM 13675]